MYVYYTNKIILKIVNVCIGRWEPMATLRCPDLHIAETSGNSVFQSPLSHAI